MVVCCCKVTDKDWQAKLTLLKVLESGARQGRAGATVVLFVCLSVRVENEWAEWWQRGQEGAQCSARRGASQGGGVVQSAK